MVEGAALRVSSDIEGAKRWFLQPLEGEPRDVGRWAVALLQARGDVLCNDKFPVSTYVLTDAGAKRAGEVSSRGLPIRAR